LPRSLFLKIFKHLVAFSDDLWFGAVLITVIVGTFLVGELTRPEPFRQPQRRPIDLAISTYAQTAAEIYERDGQNALAGYIDSLQRESHIHTFLFNGQLHELSGRRMPDGAPGLAQKALETQLPKFASNESAPLLARPVLTARGGKYVLVAEMPPRLSPPRWYDHGLHLLIIILIGATFCYWLAKYLTSPVAKLRAATQELAGGNLAVRVTPALGKRRDELASLGADFDLMAEQIESLLKSQRRLLGDISHELRSPLARLNVALELAWQRAGPEATSALERIQREAENLNEMIGQVLALTRVETGAGEFSKNEFDLARLVQEIADDADFEARSSNRSVRITSYESCTISGTEELLRPAIENAVRNAVQYTATGTEIEIQLRVDLGPACGNQATEQQENLRDANPDKSNRCAVITVRDHGAGVPDAALAEIFRPFYRVDYARDCEAGGVGLGLAITERAIRLHGGTVTAANAADGGLVVTIILPIRGA